MNQCLPKCLVFSVQTHVSDADILRILKESNDSISSNSSKSEVSDVDKEYTQFSDSDMETDEEKLPGPQMFAL